MAAAHHDALDFALPLGSRVKVSTTVLRLLAERPRLFATMTVTELATPAPLPRHLVAPKRLKPIVKA
jgi:hypothetical protein